MKFFRKVGGVVVVLAILISLFSVSPDVSADLSTGLMGYWNFDEGTGSTAADSSGNLNHGSLTNSPTWTAGQVGSGSLVFNGANKVTVNNSTSISAMPAMTVAAWVKMNSGSSSGTLFAKRHNSSPWSAYYISFDANLRRYQPLVCNTTGSCNGWVTSGNNSIVFDTWQHVAMVYDGATVRMYLNGTQAGGAASLSGNVFPSNGQLFLAGNIGGTGLNGSMDEFRIYNRALSPTEITELFNFTGSGDVAAPIISNGSPSGALPAGTSSTTMSVATDEDAVCKFDTSSGIAFASMANTFSSTGTLSHSVTINGLSDGQAYTYYVRCQDTIGNANSIDYVVNFSVSSPPDTIPPVISNVNVTGISSSQATISWSTDEPADSQIDYGLSSSYGSSTTLDAALVLQHSQVVSGLSPNTTYHFQVKSRDASTNLGTSNDLMFTTAPYSLANGLESYWTFDEGSGSFAHDFSGNGNHAVLVNNPVWTLSGVENGAINLSNPNDFLVIGNDSQYSDLCVNGCAFGGWVKPNGTPTNFYNTLIGRWDFENDDMFFKLDYDQFQRVRADIGYNGAFGSSFQCSVLSGAVFNYTNWQHVIAAFDGSTLRLYLNGAEIGATNCAFTGIDAVAWQDIETTYLGLFDTTGNQGYLNASLDSMVLFSRALSLSEIQEIYANGLVTTITDPFPPVMSGGSPTGTLSSGTQSVDLSVLTDESATCKYGTLTQVGYDLIQNTFASTGGTTHTQTVNNLSDGSYQFVVKCADLPGNQSISDYVISFDIGTATPPPGSAETVDLYVDFEYGTSGEDFATLALNSSTYGSGFNWFSYPKSQSKVSTQFHDLGVSADVSGAVYSDLFGGRSVAHDHSYGNAMSAMDLTSSHDNVAAGLFVKTSLPVLDYGYYDLFLLGSDNGVAGCVAQWHNSNLRAHSTDGVASYLGPDILVAQNTWYWISLKWERNSGCFVEVYDPVDWSLVGSSVSPLGNQQAGRLMFGGNNHGNTPASVTLFDNILLDWTDATFPLGIPSAGQQNNPPSVSVSQGSIVVNLSASVSDDSLPNPPGSVILNWSKVSGPGSVVFGSPNSANTTATFSQAGNYVVRITADDGGLVTIQDVDVNLQFQSL